LQHCRAAAIVAVAAVGVAAARDVVVDELSQHGLVHFRNVDLVN
jgi:hypothetical protein